MLPPARLTSLTMAALLLASAATSQAQTCPIPGDADPKLGQVDAKDRVAFLRKELGSHARYAHLWTNSWLMINTAVLAGQITLTALTDNPDDRTDYVITSLFAVAPPIGNLLFQLRVGTDGPRFLRLDHLDTEASRCVLVRRGEQFLERDAQDEADNNGWLTQGLLLGGNTALTLVLGLGYGHWVNGLLNFGGGMLLGELQFFTQPTGLIGAWKRYKAGDLGTTTAAAHATVRLVPQLSAGSYGLGLAGTF